MPQLETSRSHNLPEIAACHQACFPGSFSSRLGTRYVAKTLDWFLSSPNRFLFHVKDENRVLGYCGGFLPQKVGDGSSSGMLQHAFKEAMTGLALHPWLLFDKELRAYYPLLWLNIKRKITGKAIPIKKADKGRPSLPFQPAVGLVVIGVHPEARGTGVLPLLLEEFDRNVLRLGKNEAVLTVKKDNSRAIRAYEKHGWTSKMDKQDSLLMHKQFNGSFPL